MLSDPVYINSPDTKGPIELYMQYVMQIGLERTESRILVDEMQTILTDESGVELMK